MTIKSFSSHQLNVLNKAGKTGLSDSRNPGKKLMKACNDFEAIFISQLFKTMRGESDKKGLFGKGLGGDLYQGLFDSEIAREMASGKGIGLARRLYESFDLDKSLTDKSGSNLSVSSLERINVHDDDIRRAGREFNIDPALIYAVIQKESDGVENVVSHKGAKGLMQLMDTTARELGVQNVMNPSENIRGGVNYLRQMLNRFDGNLEFALAAYNAGPGNVERFGGVPPWQETRQYVSKVLESYEKFKIELD